MSQTMILVGTTELEQIIRQAVESVLSEWGPPATEPLPPDTDTTSTMTRREVLRALQLTPPTLLRLEETGALRPLRIGRVPRWRRSDVEQFIASTIGGQVLGTTGGRA